MLVRLSRRKAEEDGLVVPDFDFALGENADMIRESTAAFPAGDAAVAILLPWENAMKTAPEAVQALGGAGHTKDWPVERYMRDAKLLAIGAGTNEIRRMLIDLELAGV